MKVNLYYFPTFYSTDMGYIKMELA